MESTKIIYTFKTPAQRQGILNNTQLKIINNELLAYLYNI